MAFEFQNMHSIPFQVVAWGSTADTKHHREHTVRAGAWSHTLGGGPASPPRAAPGHTQVFLKPKEVLVVSHKSWTAAPDSTKTSALHLAEWPAPRLSQGHASTSESPPPPEKHLQDVETTSPPDSSEGSRAQLPGQLRKQTPAEPALTELSHPPGAPYSCRLAHCVPASQPQPPLHPGCHGCTR